MFAEAFANGVFRCEGRGRLRPRPMRFFVDGVEGADICTGLCDEMGGCGRGGVCLLLGDLTETGELQAVRGRVAVVHCPGWYLG